MKIKTKNIPEMIHNLILIIMQSSRDFCNMTYAYKTTNDDNSLNIIDSYHQQQQQ